MPCNSAKCCALLAPRNKNTIPNDDEISNDDSEIIIIIIIIMI